MPLLLAQLHSTQPSVTACQKTPQTFNAALAGSRAPHMDLSQHVGKHTALPAGCVVYIPLPSPPPQVRKGQHIRVPFCA